MAGQYAELKPGIHIAYGLYATPLYELLTSSGLADSVIGGEYEIGLAALADQLSNGKCDATPDTPVSAASRDSTASVILSLSAVACRH